MIDFAKITKTIGGLDCYYLGQRRSYGENIHRFAVVNGQSERFCYYNDAGKRVDFTDGKWSEAACLKVDKDAFEIIAPPKIVELTKWIGLSDGGNGNYSITFANSEDGFGSGFIAKQQHTFRFEVPNE